MPRASYAPSGGEREDASLYHRTGVAPEYRGWAPLPKGPVKLSIPDSPETSKPGRVTGVVTSQTQAGILLAGGWQGRQLLLGSEDFQET